MRKIVQITAIPEDGIGKLYALDHTGFFKTMNGTKYPLFQTGLAHIRSQRMVMKELEDLKTEVGLLRDNVARLEDQVRRRNAEIGRLKLIYRLVHQKPAPTHCAGQRPTGS